MEKHTPTAAGLPMSELAVFQQLATIAHQSAVRTDSSRQAAMALLASLMQCCLAHRGAVFLLIDGLLPEPQLEPQYSLQSEPQPEPQPVHQPAHPEPMPLAGAPPMNGVRTLALHDISTAERELLLSVLANGNAGNPAIHLVPDVACWLTFKLDVGIFPMPLLETPMPAPAATRDATHTDAFSEDGQGHEKRQVHALLALGWTGLDSRACIASVERGQRLLPLVAPAVQAALASILQAEQLQQLEATRVYESLHGMELLKAELLASVSHELRSPLASIKGYAATLLRHERRIAREERHQFLVAIAQSSDRLERSIERLLDMSLLETQGVTLTMQPVDLAALSQEAITALDTRLASQTPGRFRFTIRVVDAAGAPARTAPLILADRRRMREALDNVLENAVIYSPEGGTISVILRPLVGEALPRAGFTPGELTMRGESAVTAPATNMLEWCVCDPGIGIAPNQLERIFERFYRIDQRLTRETNGLGLGLTMCKRIVELHGGYMWAESWLGEGSIVHVALPIAPIDEETTP
jgi:signal transduction histidine kinase